MLRKLLGVYLLVTGFLSLFPSILGASINPLLQAVLFFPEYLLSVILNAIGFGSVPVLGGLLLSYGCGIIGILLGLLLL